MELWNLLVSFFANIPLYYQTNRNLFLVTLGVVLVYSAINFYSYVKTAAALQSPIAKAGYLLVTLIGVLALVASGVAFISAQEVAELRPEVLTRPLFFQLAVAGALYAVIWLVIIWRRGDELEGVEAEDAFKSLLKGGFVAIFSLVGAFVGQGISSWGFHLFGRTLGTWLFGAYLAWAMKAVLGVAGFVVQAPLVLLFGNPDAAIEDAIDGAVDGVLDEFWDKPKGQRDWKRVIVPAVVVVAAIVGLGMARSVFQEEATVPEVPTAESTSQPALEDMPEDHVMSWGDPVLEQYMREVTGISEGDIWLHDVWGLTALDLSVRPNEDNVIEEAPRITSIAALSELANLQWLELTFQDVEDISAVAGMPHLTFLDLQYNPVGDLAPLAGLTELDTLYAGYTHVYDLTPLAGLTQLRALSLNNSRVRDVEPLRGLTNLEYLNLIGDSIDDYAPIEDLEIEDLRI